MKKYLSYTLSLSLLLLAFSCNGNFEELEVWNAEALSQAEQLSPSNNASLTLNSGTPEQEVLMTWEPAKAGLDSEINYHVLVDKKGGDFENPLLRVQANNEGKATQAGITHKQLNDAIAGVEGNEFSWVVEAQINNPDFPNSTTTTSNLAYELNINKFGTGISNFTYLGPEQNQKIALDKIRTPEEEVIIEWMPATPVGTEEAVTYRFQAFTNKDNLENPAIDLPADNNGESTSLTLTHTQFTEILSSIDYEDGLFWRVQASVSDFTYSPEIRFMWFEVFDVNQLYVLGDATEAGWNNNETDPIALTKDGEGLFSAMLPLQAGAIKFILNRGSWDNNWGAAEEGMEIISGQPYPLVSGGPNIIIPTAGNYLVSVNFLDGTFTITEFNPPANLYLVGGSTSAGWDPASAIPFVKLEEGVFEIYSYLTASEGGFKFLETRDWAGDWGLTPGSPGTIQQEGEENVNVGEDGFYRITVDFSNFSYSLEEMNWGLIGDATPEGWEGADADLIFQGGKGSYTWQGDITLTSGVFKFRANDGWDVNLGDNNTDGSLEYGGENIPVTAGDYTIELILDPVNGYTYKLTAK